MINISPHGLFDDHFLLEKLSKLSNPLTKLSHFIDWEIFRATLEKAFSEETIEKSKGGRPPLDKFVMFKVLIIQSLYNLSDDQLEYQIIDRASFKRFLKLKKSDKIPDRKTFWIFREHLVEKDVILCLFRTFSETLDDSGIFASEGKMIDASFVEAPRQRNSREENKYIKETGTDPKEWDQKPNKKRQKVVDAKWTKINNIAYYGYKNHIKADVKTKLIETFEITAALVHNSQPVGKLIREEDMELSLYADSAYTDAEQEKVYVKKNH